MPIGLKELIQGISECSVINLEDTVYSKMTQLSIIRTKYMQVIERIKYYIMLYIKQNKYRMPIICQKY